MQNAFGSTYSSLDSSIAAYYVDNLVTGSIKPRGLVNAVLNDLGLMPKVDGSLGKPAGWGFGPGVDLTADQINAYKTDIGYVAPSSPGETFDLTTGADLVQGTAGDDTINGLVGTNPSTGVLTDTAQNVDIVSGGEGNDTIKLQTQGAGTLGITLNSVENIEYTVFADQTFNAANTTGLETLTNTASIADLTVTNLSNLVDLAAKSVTGNKTILTYSADAVSSLTDVQNIALDGATDGHVLDFNDASIETYSIVTSGSASKVVLDDIGTTVKTITVAGDQDLNLSFLDSTASTDAITSFDASAATGNLTVDLMTNVDASDMAVQTGSGDDKVIFGNFDKNDTIDLGAGNDTLVLDMSASVTTPASITNVEHLVLDADGNYTLNLSDAAALESVEVGVSAAQRTFTLTNLAPTANTLVLNGDGATADASIDIVNFGLKTSTGTSDALTINIQNIDANGNAVVPTAKGVQLSTSVTANGIETITVHSDQLGADTNATTQDGGALLTFTSADKLQVLNLSGTTLLDLDGAALSDTVKTVSAADADGGVLLDMSVAEDATTVANGGTGSISVLTGDGADTVASILGKVATTVSTGAGDDTISLKAGTDIVKAISIDAGAGNDSIDLSGDGSAIAKNVTTGTGVDSIKILSDGTQTNVVVSDFTTGNGGDILDLSDAATDIVVGGTGNITDYKEAADFADANAWGGMNVLTATVATLDKAGLTAVIENTTALTDGDKFFMVASNGVDAGLFYVEDAGADTWATATVTLVGTFSDVTDASHFAVQNFADFLA